jgi:2-methylisocitrate lyase-like PEP mutase family enzyme
MSTESGSTRAANFLGMHDRSAGFVLPNVWDPGSARVLERVGFRALATSSAGIAFAHGRPDGTMTRDEMLAAVAPIVTSVLCPVSADLEAGYSATTEGVGTVVGEAVSIGVLGANIEDQDPSTGTLFAPEVAADRIAAARSAAPTGTFVLNARVDSYLLPGTEGPGAVFDDAVTRAALYVAAGADCIFVPGVDDPATIAELVEGIDAPLNVVVGLTDRLLDLATLRSLGVARITVGGSLARAALGFVERVGHDLLDGNFDHARAAIPHGELQVRFAASTDDR